MGVYSDLGFYMPDDEDPAAGSAQLRQIAFKADSLFPAIKQWKIYTQRATVIGLDLGSHTVASGTRYFFDFPTKEFDNAGLWEPTFHIFQIPTGTPAYWYRLRYSITLATTTNPRVDVEIGIVPQDIRVFVKSFQPTDLNPERLWGEVTAIMYGGDRVDLNVFNLGPASITVPGPVRCSLTRLGKA